MSSSTSKNLKLTDIDPLDLARQLTLLESALYQKIQPMEFLQRARQVRARRLEQGSDSAINAMAQDNIGSVIQTTNRIVDWMMESVLSSSNSQSTNKNEEEDARKRAGTVEYFVLVAAHCRALHNFSTMTAIVCGLNSSPIRRLRRTWAQVSQQHMAQFREMRDGIEQYPRFRQVSVDVGNCGPALCTVHWYV
ncbi:ras GEF [Gymnopus androsaceus JB14]|uniref:Ras GEF n=1 Tax=Gymnopus androsaceus JB14 TaxID=1447944 RepID=A0A6A4I9X8_9AGAR|nr:ras GEF [Gymnopus androsaceus JB14]